MAARIKRQGMPNWERTTIYCTDCETELADWRMTGVHNAKGAYPFCNSCASAYDLTCPATVEPPLPGYHCVEHGNIDCRMCEDTRPLIDKAAEQEKLVAAFAAIGEAVQNAYPPFKQVSDSIADDIQQILVEERAAIVVSTYEKDIEDVCIHCQEDPADCVEDDHKFESFNEHHRQLRIERCDRVQAWLTTSQTRGI